MNLMIGNPTRMFSLFVFAGSLLPATEPPAIWRVINGESDVAEIVYECKTDASNAKLQAEVVKAAKAKGLSVAVSTKPFIFRTAKMGSYYTTECLGSFGGEVLWAQGRNEEVVWRFESSTLSMIGHTVKSNVDGEVLKNIVVEIANDVPFNNAIKLGVPISLGAGKWDGDEFSGQGMSGQTISNGKFGYEGEKLAFAHYILVSGNRRMDVTVRYSNFDGDLPRDFTIERSGDVSGIFPAHESYRILAINRTPAKADAFNPHVIVPRDKIKMEFRHGQDAITFISKDTSHTTPMQAPLKRKLWWVLAVVIITTPIFVLYNGGRKNK